MNNTELELRDRIAIEALNGMLAHSTKYRPRVGANPDWHLAIAEEAYEIADAMLSIRGSENIPTVLKTNV